MGRPHPPCVKRNRVTLARGSYHWARTIFLWKVRDLDSKSRHKASKPFLKCMLFLFQLRQCYSHRLRNRPRKYFHRVSSLLARIGSGLWRWPKGAGHAGVREVHFSNEETSDVVQVSGSACKVYAQISENWLFFFSFFWQGSSPPVRTVFGDLTITVSFLFTGVCT